MSDINELDEQDVGLKTLMGKRFKDITEEYAQPECETQVYVDAPEAEEVPADLRKMGMDFTDKLMAFCKKSLVFAVASWACFFWEAKGLMDASIAVPAMWLCAVSAGFGAGRLVCEGRK